MKSEKKSILSDALTDFNEIMESANANAKKKLAEEFPEKFSNILKEELNKNKITKESYKKIDKNKESDTDETEEKNEFDMKKETKETVKVGQHANKSSLNEKSKIKSIDLGDDFERDDEFTKKTKDTNKSNFIKGKVGLNDKKSTKNTNASSGKSTLNKVHEEFDLSGMNSDMVNNSIDNADDDDQFLTLDDIEAEIANMENLGEELNDVSNDNPQTDPYEELVNMRDQLDEMIEKLGGVKEQKNTGGRQNFSARNSLGKDGGRAGLTKSQIDEKDVAEQKKFGGKQSFSGRVNGGPTSSMIDEDDRISDEEIEEILNKSFDDDYDDFDNLELDDDSLDLDESLPHPISHANARLTGAQNNTNYGKEQRLRYAMRESNDKKVNGLINVNKKLLKKVNEAAKYRKSATTLIENYNKALEKYRNQLKEMAVFNSNLAHVNNLFINENLALTYDDKIKIINEFKNITSITKSQEKYNKFLSEMKISKKKNISETIKNKVSMAIHPSSKQKLDEVVEKTAYENNDHLNKMKRIIESIEKRDKNK